MRVSTNYLRIAARAAFIPWHIFFHVPKRSTSFDFLSSTYHGLLSRYCRQKRTTFEAALFDHAGDNPTDSPRKAMRIQPSCPLPDGRLPERSLRCKKEPFSRHMRGSRLNCLRISILPLSTLVNMPRARRTNRAGCGPKHRHEEKAEKGEQEDLGMVEHTS